MQYGLRREEGGACDMACEVGERGIEPGSSRSVAHKHVIACMRSVSAVN